MGLASRITAVVFRIMEFISAVIVAALLGRYLRLLDLAGTSGGSRVIYAEVIAGLSIFFSLILIPPVRYSFYAFPLDFALFICWMVAFGLLDNVSCSLPLGEFTWECLSPPLFFWWWLMRGCSSLVGGLALPFGTGTLGAITGAGSGIRFHAMQSLRL
jgi:hypothetical protein